MARTVSVDGPHPVDRHVGQRVAELRLQRGFNQSDLGRALGLTFQQVQKYEKGTNRVSSSKLWDMAKFLRVDVGHFFEGLDAGAGMNAVDMASPSIPPGPATRHTIELAQLAPQLSIPQQKLALDLVRSLIGRDQS